HQGAARLSGRSRRTEQRQPERRAQNRSADQAGISSCSRENKVEAMAHLAEVCLVTSRQFHRGIALISDIAKGGINGFPIDLTVAQWSPGGRPFEVFDVEFDYAFAQNADPVLRIPVKDHVTDVEVSPDPLAVEFINVTREFEWTEQEFVPDLFHRDDYLEFTGEWNELADLFLRALPGVCVAGFRIDYGRNQQNGVRAPELGVAEAGLHSGDALGDCFGVIGGQRIPPVIHVHHRM